VEKKNKGNSEEGVQGMKIASPSNGRIADLLRGEI